MLSLVLHRCEKSHIFQLTIHLKIWHTRQKHRQVEYLLLHIYKIHTTLRYYIRGWLNFFCERWNSNYFRFWQLYSFCHNYSILLSLHENSHRQQVNKWVWLCPSEILFAQTGGGVRFANTSLYYLDMWTSHYIILPQVII